MDLKPITVHCPYCGEPTEVDVEPLEETQSFIEDCTVCCRPMQLEATHDTDEGIQLVASRSD